MTKEQFLLGVGNWSNHRFLLWPALEATKHLMLPVLELGCGEGSTPYLRQYCKDEGLELISYDFSQEWAAKYNAIHTDWNDVPWTKEYGVVLVDESPGEQRRISIPKLHHAKIVVCHDTEPPADHGYQVRAQLKKFRYMIDYESPEPGAWASAASNFIDVRKFIV